MKRYFPALFILVFFAGCRNQASVDQGEVKDSIVSSASNQVNADSLDLDDSGGDQDSTQIANEFQTYYLVTIAEGNNYDSLLQIAQEAGQVLNLKVDLMNRIYKSGKGIVLKEDDEDEIYRGEYYPRRSAGDFVSIEMKNAFIENENDPMRMLVISNIFEKISQADSVQKIAGIKFPFARTVKAELFTGCMH
jgi:hypothetical protein